MVEHSPANLQVSSSIPDSVSSLDYGLGDLFHATYFWGGPQSVGV